MNRRQFLRNSFAAGAGISFSGALVRAETAEKLFERPRSNRPRLPMREYGKTGVKLSTIGFPGFALRNLDRRRVGRLVAEAVERGVNYFDVAPKYGDAEERLGPALKPYRKNVFLACKTAERTREGAAEKLEQSLAKLQTDHLDLYQLHHITDVKNDVDTAFAKGGAMELFTQAKKEGRVRFLGFSAHSVEAAFAAMDRYDFDSALFPINFACMFEGGWGQQIVEKCQEKGVICLALKPLARQHWPQDAFRHPRYKRCWYEPITDLDEADLSLRYTLSQPVAAAIPPAAEFLFRPAVDLAMDYTPVTEEETARLKTLAKKLNPLFRHHG
jgi:predicted aldo/keto reductase-like oxidoreductase